jgi:anti-sigma factor ChrR (cupin superfamily)
VRYAPQSRFPTHTHPGGEEVLVLSGTFSEDGKHYPAGWYLRNPPGSGHQPSSKEGALIFVKLRQIPAAEERPVRLDTRNPTSWRRQAGRVVCPLFSSDAEQVCLQRLSQGEVLFGNQAGGAELLVLAGDLIVSARSCVRGSWLRLPPGDNPGVAAGTQGATIYLKTGHLAATPVGA